jgi:hypothetical protein
LKEKLKGRFLLDQVVQPLPLEMLLDYQNRVFGAILGEGITGVYKNFVFVTSVRTADSFYI